MALMAFSPGYTAPLWMRSLSCTNCCLCLDRVMLRVALALALSASMLRGRIGGRCRPLVNSMVMRLVCPPRSAVTICGDGDWFGSSCVDVCRPSVVLACVCRDLAHVYLLSV